MLECLIQYKDRYIDWHLHVFVHTSSRFMRFAWFPSWPLCIPYLGSKEQLGALRETRAEATWQHLSLCFPDSCISFCAHAFASKAVDATVDLTAAERRAVLSSVANMSLTLRDIVRSRRPA